MTLLIVIGIIYVGWLLLNGTLKLIEQIKKQNADKEYSVLNQQKVALEEKRIFIEYKKEVKASLETLQTEKAKGFPWLSTAISDYYENYDLIFAKYLETKSRPALVQAERIKEIAKEKKLFKKEYLMSKYIIGYYESLFPWLQEYVGFNSEELIKSIHNETTTEEKDPVSFYITNSEFENLSVSERNQRALDRYWKRDKDPWQIGRDYERYIGHLYEMKGFKVEYHGIERLKEDMGRDLICIKGDFVEIVQCKYWSNTKGIPIRENHITQLYGTTIKYFLDQVKTNKRIQLDLFPELLKSSNIIPVLVTTAELSKTAEEFANVLGIRIDKIQMNNSYPCIKCNVNFQSGEQIYHLPFDQQYDKAMIDITKGERWAKTIKEAEELGFRRAWRWNANKGTSSTN